MKTLDQNGKPLQIYLTGFTENDLFKKVTKALSFNKIAFDPASIRQNIRRQNHVIAKKTELKLADTISGANALIKFATTEPVDNQEIARRSEICASCAFRSDVSDCKACGAAKKIAGLVNLIRKARKKESEIPVSVRSRYCGVCSCSLALLVVTKAEDFHKESPEKLSQRPDYCWLKKINLNSQ